MPLDNAGNTLSTAKSLNITNTTQTLTDWVGSTDINDYYRFSLNGRSSLNLTLNGLSADANVRMIRDSNSNGVVDTSEIITGSYLSGTQTESINATLDSGAYFIQVYSATGSTSYNLGVSAKPVNVAPSNLQFNLNSTNLKSTDTLGINGGWVYDGDGATDISKVDFRIKKADGSFVDVTDPTLTPASWDNRWGSFNYNLSLSNLNLATGNYSLWAQAYDKSGAVSNAVERSFSFTGNNAPTNLQFNLNNANLKSTDTLGINGGWVYDANGATDISKVDFRIKKADGSFVDVADAINFTPNSGDNRWGSFNYNLSLANLNLAGGNYRLSAIAYDKAGAASNSVEQAFTIQAIGDWFSQNLRDEQISQLARTLATDKDLSRNDMLAIFRNAEDGYQIDGNEFQDLTTLINKNNPFTMREDVRWLSSQVASGASMNMSASQFESNLVGRWFLGTVAPTARFDNRNNNGTVTTFNLDYMKVEGNLFGSSGQARIGDIDQGYLGDCAFLAALGATFGRQLSEAGNTFSSIINNMIIDNGDKTYTMKFFNNGVAEYATVDNRLAVYNGSLFTSRKDSYLVNPQNTSIPLWVPLVQKAYAEWREWGGKGELGYNLMGNGDTLANPLEYITGRKANYSITNNITFSSLETALKNGQAVTTDRYGNRGDTNLIVGSHAYSLTNVYINNGGQQRVVLRNPWGVDNYWFQEKSGTDDGFIDLSFDDFRNTMNEICIA